MKILVADDSITNLSLLTSSLQTLGHDVMAASSGQEAIDMFITARPDLIILDVVMKEMDGFECAKKIRNFSVDDWIPIIFLSSLIDDESIAKGIEAGGDDYLTKPFSEIKLAAKIKAMQRISTMRQTLFDLTQKLSRLSSTDTLTGVNNRLQFDKTIQEKIASAHRKQCMLAILSLDLDKFKLVNDTFGHHIGDLLLIEVTKRLQTCLRIDDFLARMGGDEFIIILSNIENKEIVGVICQKIMDVLSPSFNLDGHKVQCSTSIGIIFYPDDGLEQETLTKNADIAMYHAKKLGRNNYQYLNPLKELKQNTSLIKNKSTVLNCLVNKTHVCIDLHYITKILPLSLLEPIPNSPDYLIGLMNFSGKSLPIIDLGTRINLVRTELYSLETPILLCSDGINSAGFIVDKIFGLYEINKEDLQPYDITDNASLLFLAITSIHNELSLLVNMQKLLTNALVESI